MSQANGVIGTNMKLEADISTLLRPADVVHAGCVEPHCKTSWCHHLNQIQSLWQGPQGDKCRVTI